MEISKPDFFLEAGSGSHAEQTAKVMVAFEKVCEDERPDIVVVVGDVNSTLACSVVAKKLMIDVAHVEAGLRSFDLTMPEEINRMVTDAITDYFFTAEKAATANLLKEGKAPESIYFVGHVMIDNVLQEIFDALDTIAEEVPFIFPVHPRTRKQIDAFGIRISRHIHQVSPLGLKNPFICGRMLWGFLPTAAGFSNVLKDSILSAADPISMTKRRLTL